MATQDIIHDAVKNALIKDGWKITHDPYVIKYEEVTLYADLGGNALLRLSWLALRSLWRSKVL